MPVGVVAAFGGSTSFYGWRPEHEFTYRFESQVLTGIPQIRNQYSGLKLTSNVLIQTKSDYSLIVKFLNPKFVVVNQELQLRQGRPIIPAPHEDIPEPLGKYLKESFQVNLKAGVVESFFVEESEPVVVTNIKKSLLSQLQMDLSGIRRSEIPRTNAIPKGNAEEELVGGEGKKTFFSTEESTLNGDCQVDYNMVPLAHYESKNIEAAIKEEELELKVMNILTGPKSEGGEKECEGKQYWSVTKTLNFDNCRQRPVYMSTTGIKSFCDASKSECKDVATQASSSRYIVCGSSPEDFVIRKIEHENSGVGSPLGINTEEKTLTTSYVSLYLVHVKSGGYTPLPRPSGGRKEKTSLVFEYPKEFLSHKAETSGRRPTAESGEFQPLRPMPTLHEASPMYPSALKPSQIQEQVVKQFDIVIENIALSPESCGEKHDLAGIVQSVAMNLRSLNFSELKDLERQIRSHFSSGSKKYELAVNMFYDVLAMVGSNPAVVLLKEKFVERKIEDSQAVALIQNIIRNVRTPTKEIMRELLSLVKTLKSEGMKSTYFSAIVQLSNLVYRACVEPSRAVSEFPVRIYGRFCTKDSEFITHEYIPYLTRSLEHTECPMETMVVISALGKVGHKKALVPLTKAIEGEMGSNKPLARAAAVYALKRVAKREPTLTRPILLSLITNLSESTEVRLAAVAVLPWAQPSVAELQKIAIRSWYEPSKQVRPLQFHFAFIFRTSFGHRA